MTAHVSVDVTGCETAKVHVDVANFVDFVHVDIRGESGTVIAARAFDTVPLPNGDPAVRFVIEDMFPGQLTFTGLPPGQIRVEVTETAANGVVSGPGADSSHVALGTVKRCEVETTTAPPTSETATTLAPPTTDTAAPATSTPAPTTATAGPTTAVPTTSGPTATTAAAGVPTTAVRHTTTTARQSANTLPVTGVDSAPLIGTGLGFLVAGSLALLGARRRRPAAPR